MKSLTLKQFNALPYQVEEALNRLRVNFGFLGNKYKKILITSSVPDEGKTFVAVNLWRMLAEAGNKVVLVDADLRKSVLRSRYRISAGGEDFSGLAHFLSGQAGIADVIYKSNIENGYIVPVSYTVSNPSLLLQSELFPNMLNVLAEKFDYVLVDTPPLTNVADGNQIASHCDGAILVVRGGETPRKLIASSMKELERVSCELMGIVLNRVDMENSNYYSKYAKYSYYASDGMEGRKKAGK